MAENNEKSTEKQSVEPLLYINQPKFTPPKRAMQENFITKEPVQVKQEVALPREQPEQVKQEEAIPKEQPPVKKRQTKNLDFMNSLQPIDESAQIMKEKESELIDKSNSALQYFRQQQTQPPRKIWNLTPVKSFKDMEIPEKLQYLSNFPANQQPFPCEFTTENDRVKGTMHKFGTDFIMIKTLTGEEVELQTADIQTIRIALK